MTRGPMIGTTVTVSVDEALPGFRKSISPHEFMRRGQLLNKGASRMRPKIDWTKIADTEAKLPKGWILYGVMSSSRSNPMGTTNLTAVYGGKLPDTGMSRLRDAEVEVTDENMDLAMTTLITRVHEAHLRLLEYVAKQLYEVQACEAELKTAANTLNSGVTGRFGAETKPPSSK